jgi:hypothetical protein
VLWLLAEALHNDERDAGADAAVTDELCDIPERVEDARCSALGALSPVAEGEQ